MKRMKMCAPVLFCFLCIINSLSANIINITVDHALGYDCHQTAALEDIICRDLDSAIGYAVAGYEVDSNVTHNSTTISLPSGVHHITTQTNFGDANVNFTGLDHNVTVVCEYYADNETFDATEIHTWYFNKSKSVAMENIHFRNCGFPFRFIFVERVNINNCTYM